MPHWSLTTWLVIVALACYAVAGANTVRAMLLLRKATRIRSQRRQRLDEWAAARADVAASWRRARLDADHRPNDR